MSQINSIIQILANGILTLNEKINNLVKVPRGGSSGMVLTKDQEGRVIWKNLTSPAIVKTREIKLGSCSSLGLSISPEGPGFSWVDPDDVILNQSILAEWDTTILVRKQGSEFPENQTDGITIAFTSRSSANKNYYRDHEFKDTTQEEGKVYKYKLFSKSRGGQFNNLTANEFSDGIGLSWGQVRAYVRAGRGADLFPVGTVFQVHHEEFGNIKFRVVGHDQVPAADETIQHTMCLDMVDCLFQDTYDAPELLYALTEDTKAVAGKIYYTYSGNEYTQLIEETDYQVGDDIPVASWYEKNVHIDRNSYGSNDYMTSNILQWANSQGKANQWFEKQTIFDQGSKLNRNGFLRYLDTGFKNALINPLIITAKSNFDGGGSVVCTEKMFLLSNSQLFGRINNNIMQNAKLSWFTDNEKRKKTLINDNNYILWMSRSSNISDSSRLYNIGLNGEYGNYYTAAFVTGISLACIIG